MFKQKGFTLLESMTVASLIAIVAAFGLPNYFKLIARYRIDAQMQSLFLGIQTARQDAIFANTFTTMCPGKDGICGSSWTEGHIVFRDKNQNGTREMDEVVVQEFAAVQNAAKVAWKAFQNKPSLSFLSTGITAHQNGSFIICHPDYPEFRRAVIITKLGRPRYSVDSNGDGVQEDASGKNISC